MKKLNQDGSHVVAVLLVIVVIGVLGFVGYRVMNNKKSDTKTTSNSTSNSTTTKTDTKEWADGDFAVKGTFADASIVQVSDKQWRLYYATQPEVQGHNFEVYSATSTDGKTWTQESGNRKTMATFPHVVKLPDGRYRMYYQSAAVIKSAISTDGLKFTDEAGTRIDKANDQNMTFDNVAAPTVIKQDDGTYIMVYRGTINTRYAADTPNATTQVLMWATSTDGLTWTKKGLAVDSRNSTLRGQLDGPDIVKWDDGKLHVFATTYAGVYEFVFDGTKFSEGTKAFSLGESTPPANGQPAKDVAPPGDPTLAKIDGTWYMYYGVAFANGGIKYATYK